VDAAQWRACLLFTETARDSAFDDLRAADGAVLSGGWTVQALPDDLAAVLLHRGKDGAALTVIAGRQVVTAEGIEVLALATARRFEDGQSTGLLLNELRAAGIPAVLPWGLGKWMGRRGRLVAGLVRGQVGPGLLLGDNAGRPPGWGKPALFQSAAVRGIAVLPGTDPLPLPGAEEGVGRYGFTLDGGLDPKQPAVDMARRLIALKDQPPVFGRRRALGTVLGEQIALRRRKRAPV